MPVSCAKHTKKVRKCTKMRHVYTRTSTKICQQVRTYHSLGAQPSGIPILPSTTTL